VRSVNDAIMSIGEARRAAHEASRRQIEHERTRLEAAKAAAEKRRAHDLVFAETQVRLHDEGVAWSAVKDLAKGDKAVATARYEMGIAQAVLEIQEQAAYRLQADRRVVDRLLEWSMRRELAEGGAS